MDRETSRHECKKVGSDAKYQCKQTKSTQITKETLISKLCCSCVRLLVHMFIFCMPLGKYYRYIWCLCMSSMKIFFQILFVWQENDLVFSSEFEKISSQKKHKKVPFPTHKQHKLKFSMLRFQYLGHRESVHRYFIKQ